MIRFSLHCSNGHIFEVWFHSNDDYNLQRKRKLIDCPACGSTAVEKALMAPAISASRSKMPLSDAAQVDIFKELQHLTRELRKNADYVGPRFAKEARKIHFGEVDSRAIYGEASAQEVSALLDNGIEVLPLPPLPEEQN